MAEYIFKFNEQCCPAGKINKIISWNYQPGDNGGNINFVENTVFRNNPESHIWIDGENFIGNDNKIKGTLTITRRCVDYCVEAEGNGIVDNRIKAIQVGGLAAAVVGRGQLAFGGGSCVNKIAGKFGKLNGVAIPKGEEIKIKIIGGLGNMRFAVVANPDIINIDPPVSVAANNFRPEMRTMGAEQVRRNNFKVDENFDEDSHTFTMTATKPGKTMVIFKDQANCSWQIPIDVPVNLCAAGAGDQGFDDLANSNVKEDGVDSTIKDENLGYHENGHYCNCDIEKGDSFNKTIKLSSGLTGGLTSSDVYEDAEFVYGTRSIDLSKMDNENTALEVTQAITLGVGEEANINFPDVGLRYRARLARSVDGGKDGVRGAGWDSDSRGPVFSRNDDKKIVRVSSSGKIKCLAPTNFLPVLVHVYSPGGNSIGPPNPKNPKKIKVENSQDANILSYQKNDGTWTGISSEDDVGVNAISMTQSDYFLAVRCFCDNAIVKAEEQNVGFDETFEINVEGDILSKSKRFFWSKDDIDDENIKFNWVQDPTKDGIVPTVNGSSKEFKTSKSDPDGITIFAESVVTFSHSDSNSTPSNLHKPSQNQFSKEYYEKDEFYEDLDENSHSSYHHDTSDSDFKCQPEQGNTVQTRGTWCLANGKIKAKLKEKVPVVEVNGEAKILHDLDMKDMIITIKKLDKESIFNIESLLDTGPAGIRG